MEPPGERIYKFRAIEVKVAMSRKDQNSATDKDQHFKGNRKADTPEEPRRYCGESEDEQAG
jgi:hypothetical protein